MIICYNHYYYYYWFWFCCFLLNFSVIATPTTAAAASSSSSNSTKSTRSKFPPVFFPINNNNNNNKNVTNNNTSSSTIHHQERFVNYTKLDKEKVVWIHTNYLFSVILPNPNQRTGKPQLEKVTTQVNDDNKNNHNKNKKKCYNIRRNKNRQLKSGSSGGGDQNSSNDNDNHDNTIIDNENGTKKHCRIGATNGGPFNKDGSCVGPVIGNQGRIRNNATTTWPGFGRGIWIPNKQQEEQELGLELELEQSTSSLSSKVWRSNQEFYVLGEYSEIQNMSIENTSGNNDNKSRNNNVTTKAKTTTTTTTITTHLSDFVTGFGWLVYNGTIVASDHDEPKGSIQAPRTAIGVDENNHWILFIADGCERCPPPYHKGMTLIELATILIQQTNVKYAINLDGGGSSTMVVNGKLFNRPMCLDVLPIICQRPVATVICIDDDIDDENDYNYKEQQKQKRNDHYNHDSSIPSSYAENEDFVVHTLTAKRKKTNIP